MVLHHRWCNDTGLRIVRSNRSGIVRIAGAQSQRVVGPPFGAQLDDVDIVPAKTCSVIGSKRKRRRQSICDRGNRSVPDAFAIGEQRQIGRHINGDAGLQD